MTYLTMTDTRLGLFGEVTTRGLELSSQYASAQPFPHIVIDDFLPPEVLEQCLALFPSEPDPRSESFDRAQERFKRSFNPDFLEPELRSLFYSFNSRPFIQFLTNLSGIQGLIPDPHFSGGGFHEMKTGGHLSMHADFNHHAALDLERRINALIYLNKDWQPEYGGQLELWDVTMSNRVQSIVPLFNRLVVFNTTSQSNHGNPVPVAHPSGTPRRSIALYYYTATWTGDSRAHTTQFRVRPGTPDSVDIAVRRAELIKDWTPPIALRGLRKAKKAITGRRQR